MQDKNTDMVLVINCPTALASSIDAAKATVDRSRATRSLGYRKARGCKLARQKRERRSTRALRRRKIPDFETPGAAVEGIMQLVRYGRRKPS